MLASKQTNSSSVKKNSTFMETVQDKLKDIKNFSNWSAKEQMVAVGAVGVMVGALLPFVAVALPVAATGAIVALTLFFAVKAVEYTFKRLKWSAEKTVDGAKYTAEKVKDASVYTAEKAREGYYSVKGAISSVGRATREGTGATLGKMGRSLSNLSESMSSLDAIPYSIDNEGQTVVLKTEEKTRNFNSVKEMFIKEVLEDKAVNSSALTKEIFSKLGEKILEKAYSVGGPQGAKKDQLINQLKQQADFVNKLDAKKLQNLLSKNNNNLYEIFSEHHDEIKEVIRECKEEHTRFNILESFNKSAKRPKTSKAGSINSLENSSLENSLSDTDSIGTESTASSKAELLSPANRKEVKTTASLWDKVSSPFKSGKKPKKTSEVEYQALESGAMPPATVNPNRLRRSSSSSGLGDSSPERRAVTPPKVPRSFSTDSGMGSGSSTPTRQSPTIEELNRGLDEAMKELDLAVSQLPSTQVAVDTDVQQQAAQTAVKAN